MEICCSSDVTGCYMTICVSTTKLENGSMNHRTRCMMGTLPLRGTFLQSQKLKRCGGFFLMSSVLLWQFIWIGKNALALMLQKKYIKKSNKQTEYTFPMFQWVQCPVSNLSRSSNLCEKNHENTKMVSMSVFKIKQMCQLLS